MNTANVMRRNAEETNMRELCNSIPVGPMTEYERGFIDGMQHQMQSSVDKAVNAMSQRTWVGLTDEEIDDLHMAVKVRLMGTFDTKDIYRAVEAKLKEKNDG